MKNQIINSLKKLNGILTGNSFETKSKEENLTELISDIRKYYLEVKNLVIVRLDAIGDSLLFVNSVKQIRKLFPDSTITFVCYSETREIINRSPYIDVPVYIDRKQLESNKAYRELIYSKLQKFKFDVLINPLFSREFLAEEIVCFINADLKIGFNGDISNISSSLLNVTSKWYDIILNTDTAFNKFELYRNAELVSLLGGDSFPEDLPELWNNEFDEKFISSLKINFKLNDYAIVFPGTKGGKNSVKYWGSENYAAIIDHIQQNMNLKVVLLGGTDEEQICSEIISFCKVKPVLLQGQFSLWKSVELLKQAKFYLGSDTSIAHFAAALRIQTIVLLGGGHFKRFFPYPGHDHVKVIFKELDCYNCNWKCTQQINKCITGISLAEVKRIVNSLNIPSAKNENININLVHNIGSKPKIDLLLPPGNMHSWHLKEAWVVSLQLAGMLNKAFYTDNQNQQLFFDYLKKGTGSDLIIALGGDHHLHFLHDSQQKIDSWKKYKKDKICYSYESTIESEYCFYKDRAENASSVFTHFLVADENDIKFFKQRNKKVIWFPQFVDEKFFLNKVPFSERKNKVFFKGKLWSEYKLRQQIIESLFEVKLIELVDGYLPNSELVSNYNSFKAVLNPPGVFGGFNVRTFESLAAGNLLFQFLPKNRPLNNGLFNHGEHLIYFDAADIPSLKNIIRNFVNDAELYNRIAENGYNEVLEKHTINKRISTLLNWIESGKEPEYENYGLPNLKNIKDKIKVISTNDKKDISEIKVSAIVSVYNSEKFIKGCLKDLVDQSLFEKNQLEIILVNTGSQQNEETIIKEYQKLYKNIKYIKTEDRETIYSAWNRGINAASGKYITNANTDDRHKKDALEIMSKVLDDNDQIDVVYADQFKTTTINDSWNSLNKKDEQKWGSFDKDLLLFGCFIGPQPLWRKNLHEKFGLFNDQLKVVGDYEFWLRISRSAKFYHLPESLGIYYYSLNSAEHREMDLTDSENRVIQEYYLSQNILVQSDIDRIKSKLRLINQEKNSLKYLSRAKELINKREQGILLEKEIEAFITGNEQFEENEMIEKAKFFLDEIDSTGLILKKEKYSESINTILGIKYLKENDLESAKIHFENILSINSVSSNACFGLGQVFYKAEMYEQSKTMLEWAVKNDPQNKNAIEMLRAVNQYLSLSEDHNSLFESESMLIGLES